MQPSTNQASKPRKARRLKYGSTARRLVGTAILFSASVIFASEVSSYTARQLGPSMTSAQTAAMLAMK